MVVEEVELKELDGGALRTRVSLPDFESLRHEQLRVRVKNAWPKPVDLRPKGRIVVLPQVPSALAQIEVLNPDDHVILSTSVSLGVKARERLVKAARKKEAKAEAAKLAAAKAKAAKLEAAKANLAKAEAARAEAAKTEKANAKKAKVEPTKAKAAEPSAAKPKAKAPEVRVRLDLQPIGRSADGFTLLARVLHKGKPVAGARVSHSWSHGSQHVSDKDGWVKAIYPRSSFSPNSWYSMEVDVEAEGYRRAKYQTIFQVVEKGGKVRGNFPGGIILEKGRDLAKARKANKPDLKLELKAGVELSGRLMLSKGVPAAGVALRCFIQPQKINNSGIVSSTSATVHLATKTAADGSFRFVGLAPGADFLVQALLGAEQRKVLANPRVRPVAWIARGKTKKTASTLDEITISELPIARFHLRMDDGAGARWAPLLLARGNDLFSTRVLCDRLGRVALLVPSEGKCKLAANVRGYTLEVERKLSAKEVCKLTLSPPVWLTGRVTNGRNQPLANVNVSLSWSSSGKTLLGRISSSVQTKTKPDGTYRLGVQPNRRRCWLWAYVRINNKQFNPPSSIRLDIGSEDQELDIEIPGAPANPEKKAKPKGKAANAEPKKKE